MLKYFVALVFIFAFMARGVHARTIHVPGPETGNIQDAIDLADDGDVVLVHDGTRTGNIKFKGKAITVQSENGPEKCIIDCENKSRGFIFENGEGPNSILVGFTIINGVANNGAGIYCQGASPTIIGNIIRDNKAGYFGGGISCHVGSNALIINNLIINNSAGSSGGGIVSENDSKVIVTNCTIFGNSGGAVFVDSASMNIINSILWDNDLAEVRVQKSGQVDILYSCVKQGYDGQGNISSDPLFIGPENGNYHLQNTSPCLGAGTSDNAPSTDIEGNIRPNPAGSNPDIGAYESDLARPQIPIPEISLSPESLFFKSTLPDLPDEQEIFITNSGIGELIWRAEDNVDWLTLVHAGDELKVSVNQALSAGTYNGTISIISDNASNSPQIVLVELILEPEPPALFITLISPNGGEEWITGSAREIIWEYADEVKLVTLAYSLDSGNSYLDLIVLNSANTGSYQWQVPDIESSTVRIKIIGSDALGLPLGVEDQSDADFAIAKEDRPPRPKTISGIIKAQDGSTPKGDMEIRAYIKDRPGDIIEYPPADFSKIFYDPNTGWYKIELDALQEGWTAGEVLRIEFTGGALEIELDDNPSQSGGEHTLPVELSEFSALYGRDGCLIKWETQSEDGNAGFFIYRSTRKHGPYIKMNSKIIPGAGNADEVREYKFLDEKTDPYVKIYFYYIEDVDFSGKRTKHEIIHAPLNPDISIFNLDPENGILGNIKKEFVPMVKEIPVLTNALFQNYPNPFNPETWIPYQLAKSANIKISIYDARGQFVHVLQAGYQNAGIYTAKDKAIYWDGKNSSSEQVGSGVYFYILQAGKFSASRRMLIIK